jgi:DNA-binding response OmpR family regulator
MSPPRITDAHPVREERNRQRVLVDSRAIEILADVLDSLKAVPPSALDGDAKQVWKSGDLEIDVQSWIIRRAGEDIQVTRKEFELLRILVEARGAPVPRRMLWSKTADAIPNSSRSLDAHVWSLRKKLEKSPSNPAHILTVMRYGYCLV